METASKSMADVSTLLEILEVLYDVETMLDWGGYVFQPFLRF